MGTVRQRDVIRKHDEPRPNFSDGRGDPHLVVVSRAPLVLEMRFDDGQHDPLLLYLGIGHAQLADEIGAADLTPDQIVGMVRDAHLIGFHIADAEFTNVSHL